MVRLWTELGTTMRRVRGEAGVSLRELESRGAWRRSTLSQVETGKARPSRELVEWYDRQVGSDGLLLSIYAEARTSQLRILGEDGRGDGTGEDIVGVVDVDPPAGLLVSRGQPLRVRVTLRNDGTTTWRGRRLRRMGAHTGRRLITSVPEVAVPDTRPGGLVELTLEVQAPRLAGSAIAYWSLVTEDGRESAISSRPVAVLLVVE